jgi:hypothetical protein
LKKTLLEAYALAVCFVTLFCVMVVLTMAVYRSIQVVYPPFTISASVYLEHQSNDLFWSEWDGRVSDYHPQGTEPPKKKVRPDETQLTQRRLDSLALKLDIESWEGLQSLVQLLITAFFASFVFLIHWVIARRARKS